MMSVLVSKRPKNYGRIGKRGTQVRKRIWKKRKRLGGLFNRENVKKKGKNLETLYEGMIRNVMCLRLQRGWSKLVSILLVKSA